MRIASKIMKKLFYQEVGKDAFGNKYYVSTKKNADNKNKRMVEYANCQDEASTIPPMWHMWLHYAIDELPKNNDLKYNWQKAHEPNQTGSKHTHLPKGHLSLGQQRKDMQKYYDSWDPNNN